MSPTPPSPPPPPPSRSPSPGAPGDWPPPSPTTGHVGGLSTGAKVAIAIAIGLGGVVILGIVAAIAIPAFLNQQERAWEAELLSATRNAAIEVEAAATMQGGAYDQIPDLLALVDRALADSADGRAVLDVESQLSYVGPDAFGLCVEHVESGGSVSYLSDGGGLQTPSARPCP